MKIIRLIFLICFCYSGSWAHNGCGATLSGAARGLLAGYQGNTVGISWFYTGFSANNWHIIPQHLRGTKYEQLTNDRFHVVEFSAQYHVLPKLRLGVFVPYRINQRQVSNDLDHTREGLSDIRLTATSVILDNISFGKNAQLYWELGMGVRMPTGAYDPNLSEQDLPDNFNLGNGGWGYLAQTSAVIQSGNLGLNVNAGYQHIPQNTDAYTFGNQTTIAALFFLEKSWKENFKLMPSAGIYYERIEKDKNHFDDIVKDTGGKGTFVNAGLDIFYKNIRFSGQVFVPVDQTYSNNDITTKTRFNLNLSYIF